MTAVEAAPRPEHAATGLAGRQVLRGALIVTAVAAGMSAVVVATYRSTAGNSLNAAALAALAKNPAIRTLFGEPVALDDPGGFAVWRTGTVLAVLVAVWALLAATRITRGQEDAGHWDLLLAGRLTLRAVVARHLAVVAAAGALPGLAAAGALILAGATPGGAVLHGAGLALIGVFFAATGTLAAQILPTRSGASGAAVALLGTGLAVRMIGDGVDSLGWLRWASPVGLTALTRPYAGDWPTPLLVLAGAAGLIAATAIVAAGRRDLGGALRAPSPGRAPRLALLGSVPAFAARRAVRPVAAWSLGVGAYFLLIGLLVVSMTEFLTENPRFADLAAQAGFAALGSATGYLATLFALLGIPAGLFTAVRIAALAAEESDRRLTLLLSGPVTRLRLLGAEAGAAAAGAVVLTTVAGAAAWSGAAISGAHLPLGDALAGAWNVLPIAALSLGAAALALGWAPRAVALVGALPSAGGFLLLVTADSIGAPAWVRNLSPFAHLAAVPHDPVNWLASGVMLVIAALLAAVGAAGFRGRDLRG